MIDADRWQQRLATLADRHSVPGAALGILRLQPDQQDELVEVAYGVLNKDTGVSATPDSLFQIGSITKVWTATVALQLVDEGALDLDAPILEVLPDLRLGDLDATRRVTLRHLLTHTSGIDGDLFFDTGRGDDCLERFVAKLDEAAQTHPVGASWSYCNTGFTLAGRVIEHLTGAIWDTAMRERLFDPLGLTHTNTLPEEALLFRAAVGHVGEDVGDPYRAPAWVLPRSTGPAGLINATVGDVLAFARLHLTGGLAPDGTRLVREETVATMAEKHVELPDRYTFGDSWGLGWIRYSWDGRALIGHDGSTIGQAAFLRVCPAERLGVVLLTNGGNTRDLYEDLYREIFAELADIAMPRPLEPPAEPVSVDVTPFIGTYERTGTRLEVFVGGGEPTLRVTATGPLAALLPEPTKEFRLVPVADTLFAVRAPNAETWRAVRFYALASGEQYVQFGGRGTPKMM
jgi:CubicO group peptidase (beta-lactamase class C family)